VWHQTAETEKKRWHKQLGTREERSRGAPRISAREFRAENATTKTNAWTTPGNI
jgi:hypothetical protein